MLENNQRLLQALTEERTFFRSGGYGRPFRSEWRPTLLFRDSPTCVNFSCVGALNTCEECPLFRLVPGHKRDDAIPCHHIVLDSEGNTIARLYQKGTQRLLDEHYCDWLSAVIAGLEERSQRVGMLLPSPLYATGRAFLIADHLLREKVRNVKIKPGLSPRSSLSTGTESFRS